ncbi:MAG: arsenate reductase family protein [Sulfurimonas sp.]|nr:MAG: arsenate reductase family protein [Sulfurimonas sp.]
MIKIYGIKNCDSVKKALSFFKKNNLEFSLQDFKTKPVDSSCIKHWLTQIDMKLLFNSRSTTYKTFKLKELNLNDNEKIDWLSKQNLLIKRPVIEYKDKIIIGFNEENYTKVFL